MDSNEDILRKIEDDDCKEVSDSMQAMSVEEVDNSILHAGSAEELGDVSKKEEPVSEEEADSEQEEIQEGVTYNVRLYAAMTKTNTSDAKGKNNIDSNFKDLTAHCPRFSKIPNGSLMF